MDPVVILQSLALILGPSGAAYVGVKTAVNGMRADVKEIKGDVKEVKTVQTQNRERLAVLEVKVG